MTTVPEEAVKAAMDEFNRTRRFMTSDTDRIYAAIAAALPHLPQGVGVNADALKLIERLSYGYEIMFEKLCHISGTSGADQSWYMAKAREATDRLSPIHSITSDSNKPIPGDCKHQYQDFMARILSAIETEIHASASQSSPDRDDDLPFRRRDIQRGLILFRTSNNARGYTNFVSLTGKIDALPQIAKDELASLMRNIAIGLSPASEPSAARELALEEAAKWLDDWSTKTMGQDVSPDYAAAAIRALGTSCEQLNKAVSNVPDQQENEPGAHGERERALEEILREVDEIERKVWAWSGSAFLNNELEGAEDADCKTELYSELFGIGNTMHWLRTKICALSSPDHADAGKVEGDDTKWSMREVVAKAIAYHAVGDPHARTIRGDQRWEWFTKEADKFISVFGYYLPSSPSQEVAGS